MNILSVACCGQTKVIARSPTFRWQKELLDPRWEEWVRSSRDHINDRRKSHSSEHAEHAGKNVDFLLHFKIAATDKILLSRIAIPLKSLRVSGNIFVIIS